MIFKKFSNKLFTSDNNKIIDEINFLEDNLKLLDNSELLIENSKLQQEYQETQSLDRLIARSFALTREASKRTLGLRHFDVQYKVELL